jgi:Ca-activated chloride channel family protein
VYPPQLPDLFAGGQVVVLARYDGKGPVVVKLTGTVAKETREYVYEMTFPEKTTADKSFVEHLWARRKVGYLLDQIRANGEKKELIDETVALAKKYGIATPYTSYLIVPDAAVPVVNARRPDGRPDVSFHLGYAQPGTPPPGLTSAAANGRQLKVIDFARQNQAKPGDLQKNRNKFEDDRFAKMPAGGLDPARPVEKALGEAKDKKEAYDKARSELSRRHAEAVQTGKLGVDLSVQCNNLRNQCRLEQTAQRNVNKRNCLEIGGVWIDEGFDAKMTTLTIKAMSDAYFRMLERHPEMKEVFQLGNHLVWVAPNGAALVIDTNDGKEKMSDEEIDKLFVAKK